MGVAVMLLRSDVVGVDEWVGVAGRVCCLRCKAVLFALVVSALFLLCVVIFTLTGGGGGTM